MNPLSVSEKFGMMSEKQFADYLYNNPGGASKAFLLRCESLQSEKAEVRTEWKTKVEYRDREVEVPVEKVIEKKVEVKKVPVWMQALTLMSMIIGVGGMSMPDEEVVVREVLKEVTVPVEVITEVQRVVPVMDEEEARHHVATVRYRQAIEDHRRLYREWANCSRLSRLSSTCDSMNPGPTPSFSTYYDVNYEVRG